MTVVVVAAVAAVVDVVGSLAAVGGTPCRSWRHPLPQSGGTSCCCCWLHCCHVGSCSVVEVVMERTTAKGQKLV